MLSWTGTAAAVAEMSWYCAGTGREVLCWEVWALEQRRSGFIQGMNIEIIISQ